MKNIILEHLKKLSINESKKENKFKKYKRTNIAEMRPYIVDEKLPKKVSISKADKDNGSPKKGDMIARNPDNHDDMWLVAKDYFKDNFAELTDEEVESNNSNYKKVN